MNEEKFKFQVGDICSFGGEKGIIIGLDLRNIYPVQVKFSGHQLEFLEDGKFMASHTKPLLKLIERPKKKKMVTRTLQRWMNIYSDMPETFHSTKERADDWQSENKIRCMEVTISYEIEE